MKPRFVFEAFRRVFDDIIEHDERDAEQHQKSNEEGNHHGVAENLSCDAGAVRSA